MQKNYDEKFKPVNQIDDSPVEFHPKLNVTTVEGGTAYGGKNPKRSLGWYGTKYVDVWEQGISGPIAFVDIRDTATIQKFLDTDHTDSFLALAPALRRQFGRLETDGKATFDYVKSALAVQAYFNEVNSPNVHAVIAEEQDYHLNVKHILTVEPLNQHDQLGFQPSDVGGCDTCWGKGCLECEDGHD